MALFYDLLITIFQDYIENFVRNESALRFGTYRARPYENIKTLLNQLR